MTEIKYDTPIEVTHKQYGFLVTHYSGKIAHRQENGRYFIKLWYMPAAKEINEILVATMNF
jgi:hypothetical protein